MRIRELDGLRAIAILLVIGCHYTVLARQLSGLPQFGWIGVDIFFVLSGFLITTVLLELKERPHPFKTFYMRRCLRILPPYLIALAALTITTLAVGDGTLLQGSTLLKNFAFLQAFTGWRGLVEQLQHTWHSGFTSLWTFTLPVNYPGFAEPISSSKGILWSLSVEEYFYLLWAPAVLWLRRSHLVALAVVICVVEMVVRWAGFTGRDIYFSIFYRFDGPTFGAFIPLLPALPKKLALGILSAASIGVAAILFSIWPFVGYDIRGDSLFMVFGLPLVCLMVASSVSLLVNTAGANTPIHLLLRSRPMVALGTISYMLYLIHGLVYLTLLHFVSNDVITGLTAVPISLGLAALSWTYIEKPILSYRKRMPVLAKAAAAS